MYCNLDGYVEELLIELYSNNPKIDTYFVLDELSRFSDGTGSVDLRLVKDIYTGESYIGYFQDMELNIFDPHDLKWYSYSGYDVKSFDILDEDTQDVDEYEIILIQKISNYFAKKMREDISSIVDVRGTVPYFNPDIFYNYLLEDGMYDNRFVYSEYFTDEIIEEDSVPSAYYDIWVKARDFYADNFDHAIKKAKGRR